MSVSTGKVPGMENSLALRELIKRQSAVVSRAQALGTGLHPGVLRRRALAGGPWQQILPGIYLTVTGTPTTWQKDVAAVLYCGPGATLTGKAALRRHGMRVQSDAVEVLVPVNRRLKSTEFVVVQRTRRLPPYVCYAGPIQYALAARAVADATRGMRDLADVRAVVAASVQSRRCTVEQLEEELRDGPVHGSALFRRALAEVAEGARSGPEAELVALIRRGKLPRPWFNARLYAGDVLVARPDVWWPEFGVAAEVDSKEWHLSPEDWEKSMRRDARMASFGILVLRFTPRRIHDELDEVLAEIRRTLDGRRGLAAAKIRTLPAA
jgi:very-short-patch-repair endonuclease